MKKPEYLNIDFGTFTPAIAKVLLKLAKNKSTFPGEITINFAQKRNRKYFGYILEIEKFKTWRGGEYKYQIILKQHKNSDL